MEFLIIISVIVAVWSIGKLSPYLQLRQKAKVENIRKKQRETEETARKLEAINTQNEQDREAIERKLEAMRTQNEHDREANRCCPCYNWNSDFIPLR